MSKRNLKKYLNSLNKEQLEEQIIDLYNKFNDIKVFYDFVFNPKEEKLIQEAKIKISNEYFPIKRKRAKLRRSVAQKYIKHFNTLGVESYNVADLMLYTIEVAQKYSSKKEIQSAAFFKSMFNSFKQAVNYIILNGILSEFKVRIKMISEETIRQKWGNSSQFETIIKLM